ncbi:unnamed protein product [Moneuplotes crassus]|uniref:Uncharacterized protein n=1 Tax=Euplotes crassus TaxID=5936 RepID=A0AAD2D8F5_EUPCR|nr:unnamed protein product [Moneuplotes crassus]
MKSEPNPEEDTNEPQAKEEITLEDIVKSQKELEKSLITKVYQSKQETENMNKRVQDVMERMDELYPIQAALDQIKSKGETDILGYLSNEIHKNYIVKMTDRIDQFESTKAVQSDMDTTRVDIQNIKNILNSFQRDLEDQDQKGRESEQNLLQRMNTLTEKEIVEQLDMTIKQKSDELQIFADSVKENYPSREEIEEIINKIHEQNTKNFVLKKDFTDDLQKASEEVKECREFAEKKIKELNLKITNSQDSIKKRATIDQLDQTNKTIETLSSKKDFEIFQKKIRTEIVPRIRSCEDDLLKFLTQLEQNKEIIRRFDEIMSTKANKVSLDPIKHQVDQCLKASMFNENLKQFEDRFQAHHAVVDDLKQQFEALNKVVGIEIFSAVKKGIKEVRNEMKMNNSKENTVTFKDVDDIISGKVERSELISLLDFKSNKIDTDTSMKAIDILHKQIKHLSVILVEILRKDSLKMLKPKDSENISKNNTFEILNQLLSISKWINGFDPENINTTDLKLPANLNNYQDLVNEALGDIECQVIPRTLKAPLGHSLERRNQSSQKMVKLNKYLSKRRQNKSMAYSRDYDQDHVIKVPKKHRMNKKFLMMMKNQNFENTLSNPTLKGQQKGGELGQVNDYSADQQRLRPMASLQDKE